MARFTETEVQGGSSQKENASKFKGSKVKKNFKKKKAVLKGTNTWRDVDDRPKDEIALENFEKRKLYKVNEKGDKVKEFKKQGAVRPWLDLKFEENDKMTYYNGFFVKKDAVEGLDQLNTQLECEGMDKRNINRKMMKAIRKAKRDLFKDMLYEEKMSQIKSGTYKGAVKVWNKKKLDLKSNTKVTSDVKSNTEVTLDIGPTTVTKATKSKTQQISSCVDSPKKSQPKKTSKPCVNSIEGLDLNFDFSPIADEDEGPIDDNDNELMEFNGIPYRIVDTKVDRLDEQSDSASDNEMELNNNNDEDDDDNNNNNNTTTNTEELQENCAKDPSAQPENCSTEEDHEDDQQKKSSKKGIITYQENLLMTCVEGFWIRRNAIMDVDKIRTTKKQAIIAARTDPDDCPALNKEEQKKYELAVKVELNRMANQLRSFLQKKAKKQASKPPKKVVKKVRPNANKSRPQFGGPSRQSDNNRGYGDKSQYGRGNQSYQDRQSSQYGRGSYQQSGGDGQASQYGRGSQSYGSSDNSRGYLARQDSSKTGLGLVRFDGYWIKQDAAVRLKELKGKLQEEGVLADRITELLKVERRREETEVKHERRIVCFSCRKTGHVVADCPLKQNTGGVGACFKCGSLEHKSSTCTSSSSYRFATCFICRQQGHISKECPKNKNGLYPDGGGCTLCDSNQHLIKNCPRNVGESNNQQTELTAGVMKSGALLEEFDDNETPTNVPGQTKRKHVRF